MYTEPKKSCRLYKIRCVGDSNQVADMLLDISKRIRDGQIYGKDDMFYEINSQGYVRDEYRTESHEKERRAVR